MEELKTYKSSIITVYQIFSLLKKKKKKKIFYIFTYKSILILLFNANDLKIRVN